MRVIIFAHSLRSDWNHGNAHFLRGIATELIARGHEVIGYEPADGWSASNLVQDHGESALERFRVVYPSLVCRTYLPATIDLDEVLDKADVVLVHEWNSHDMVARIGAHRVRNRGYVLLFHDTHHRSVTLPADMAAYDLEHYDGVLAYGAAVRDVYVRRGWASSAFVWHEAADTRVFHPIASDSFDGDVVWIGNWGDDERSAEIEEFLIEPIASLGLRASVHGVRYPDVARARLQDAGITYRGWLPNHEVPNVFARFRATVHVPRRPYVQALRGVPTIRVFEALACGVPLVSAPWIDAEHLFTPGEDFLMAADGETTRAHLRAVVADIDLATSLVDTGLRTIRARHTCAHRVDELFGIVDRLRGVPTLAASDQRAPMTSTVT